MKYTTHTHRTWERRNVVTNISSYLWSIIMLEALFISIIYTITTGIILLIDLIV